MSKTSVVKARMEPELKAKGEAILKSLGLSTSTAITLFFTQLVSRRHFPLELTCAPTLYQLAVESFS